MIRFAAPLLAALAAVPAVAAEVAPARGEDATVALNFQDVELPVLARFVSEVTGRNLIVDYSPSTTGLEVPFDLVYSGLSLAGGPERATAGTGSPGRGRPPRRGGGRGPAPRGRSW